MKAPNKKKFALYFIVGFALALGLAISSSSLGAVKDSLIKSKLAEIYVKNFRDGQEVDADHLVSKTHNGMSIVVNKYDRCVCWFVRLLGYWDSSETKALAKVIKKDARVVEVGANFGIHTLYMADLVGEHGKVYAFEANPNVSKYLKQSVALNNLDERVQVYEMALANNSYDGFMVYGVKNIGGGFILPNNEETQAQCKDGNCTPIHVRVLDDILAQDKIDVLKMDAEGSEFFVLEGAKSILANPELTLMMEWNTNHLKRNGADVNKMLALLKDNNFHIWSIAKGGKLQPLSYESLENGMPYDLVLSRNPALFS